MPMINHKGLTKNVGVNALAREVGLSSARISQKMQAGMTPEEIRAEWRAKQTVGQADARSNAARGVRSAQVGTKAPAQVGIGGGGRSYTPARMLRETAGVPVSIPSARVPVLPSTAYSDDETDPADKPNLRDAQTRNQLALAQKNELDLLERHGLLVVNSKIAKREADRIIWARDTLLRLPGELADGLAAETNSAKCMDMLDRELRRILERLAGYYLNPASDPNLEPGGADDVTI